MSLKHIGPTKMRSQEWWKDQGQVCNAKNRKDSQISNKRPKETNYNSFNGILFLLSRPHPIKNENALLNNIVNRYNEKKYSN